jgi:hypothetical protein
LESKKDTPRPLRACSAAALSVEFPTASRTTKTAIPKSKQHCAAADNVVANGPPAKDTTEILKKNKQILSENQKKNIYIYIYIFSLPVGF